MLTRVICPPIPVPSPYITVWKVRSADCARGTIGGAAAAPYKNRNIPAV